MDVEMGVTLLHRQIASKQCDQMAFIVFVICRFTTIRNWPIVPQNLITSVPIIAKDILVYAKSGHTVSNPP